MANRSCVANRPSTNVRSSMGHKWSIRQFFKSLCGRSGQLTLKATSGLGHRKIMADPDVVHADVSHLTANPTRVEQEGSMPRDGNIFGTYRNGSAEERMDIYLEHPGLRDRFDEIEREETAGPSLENRSQG